MARAYLPITCGTARNPGLTHALCTLDVTLTVAVTKVGDQLHLATAINELAVGMQGVQNLVDLPASELRAMVEALTQSHPDPSLRPYIPPPHTQMPRFNLILALALSSVATR